MICSSLNRDRFMSVPLPVAGLYPRLEEIAVLRSMNLIGATQRIFDLALAIIGHIRGGLGYAVVLTSIIFSATSGSATADVVGVGTITVRVMRRNGYHPGFAAAITLATSTLAPIIPPSIMMIVYSVTAGVSVGRLFLAGVLPGLFIAGALISPSGFSAPSGVIRWLVRPAW